MDHTRPHATDLYTKAYKMRTVGEGDRSIEVTLPRQVIERAARRRGMSIEQFIEMFRAVAHFGDLEEVRYTFEPADTHSQ